MTPQPITTVPPHFGVSHVAIGDFDGVHRGHQAVLSQAAQNSESKKACAALTFDPHPLQIIAPSKAPPQLTTLHQRYSLMEGCGLGHIIVLRFDSALRELSAEEFVQQLR